jgi:glycosyltransferase involved in cell wall biosynthesis
VRVVHAIQSYPPVLGGAQRQLQRLGPRFAARGVDVHVVTRRPAGQPRYAEEPGLTIHRLAGTDGPVTSAGYVAGGAALVRRLHPDIVHAHDLLTPSMIGLLGGTPLVVKVLAAGPRADMDRLMHKPLGAARLRAIERRVAAFVCLSDEIAAELQAHGVPAERLVHVPNGVDTDAYTPASTQQRAAARARLGLAEHDFVAAYAGRFAEIKRVDVLLAAWRDVDGTLVLVGEGPEEREVRRLAAALGTHVVVAGRVDDPLEVLWAADAYATASVTEGMSNAVLEAMAAGLPVAASPASGMREVLGEAAGRLLADDTSPAALAARLGALAADPSARTRLGAALRARAIERFSLDRTADLLVELYRDVLRRG